MRKTKALLLLLLLSSGTISAEQNLTEQELAFEKRFKELSKLGVDLKHQATSTNPWGSPHPDAAPALQQFAFMVGHHECKQTMTGVNPSSPEQVLMGDLAWFAYYALDGRAIRDEYYSMGGNGEQTRAYDSYAKEWWVTFASVPGVVQLVPEPKPKRGSFSAIEKDGAMIMTAAKTDAKGVDYTHTITFFDIKKDGFEWKSENVFADKTINTGNISCHKVAGPDLQ